MDNDTWNAMLRLYTVRIRYTEVPGEVIPRTFVVGALTDKSALKKAKSFLRETRGLSRVAIVTERVTTRSPNEVLV